MLPARLDNLGVFKLWRNGEVRTVELAAGMLGIRYDPGRTAADVVQARRAADEALQPLTRGEALAPLPGTRREIEAIARLFPVGRVTTLLGAEATERAVQERARSGELKGYRFLHLATYGRSNPAVAMSSAVMLDPDPDRPANPTALEADGRISAEQIVQTWDLDADWIVLSPFRVAGFVRRDRLRSVRRNHLDANDFGRQLGFARRPWLRSAGWAAVAALGCGRRWASFGARAVCDATRVLAARPSCSEPPRPSARLTLVPVVAPRPGDGSDLTPTCRREPACRWRGTLNP